MAQTSFRNLLDFLIIESQQIYSTFLEIGVLAFVAGSRFWQTVPISSVALNDQIPAIKPCQAIA